MTIKQFVEIHGEGLFQDYSWDSELTDFSKANVIYAWNGTGKTTLSREMAKLNDSTDSESMKMKIKVGDKVIESLKFAERPYHIEVFNRDYIDTTVSKIDSDSVEPIYAIGPEQVKINNEIKQNNRKLLDLEKELYKNRDEEDEEKKEFDKFCSKEAYVIKNKLSNTEFNFQQYKNYDRSNYKNDVEKFLKTQKSKINNNIIQDKLSILKQIKNQNDELPIINYDVPNFEDIENKVKKILKETVTGNLIIKLQNDHNLEEWTKKGLEIFESNSSDLCPWCLQKPSEERIKALEEHFNNSFDKLNNQLNECESLIKSSKGNIPNIPEVEDSDLYSDEVNGYRIAEEALKEAFTKIEDWFQSVLSDLEEKRKNMARAMAMTKNPPSDIKSVVDRINEIIEKHNIRSKNHSNEMEKIAEKFIAKSIQDEFSNLKQFEEELNNYDKIAKRTSKKIERITDKINQLTTEARDSKVPIQELNEEISNFLGHSEIQFRQEDTGYVLVRKGGPTHKLSDGEISIIALLYFLKSLKDENKSSDELIIVLDDPVSSMDSSNLFKATMKIIECIKEYHQSFLFTHNFTLFRETMRAIYKDDINVYILKIKAESKNGRRSTIADAPEILKKYSSEYDYLFHSIYKVSEDKTSSFEWHYNLPNMARRLLESFLSYQFPSHDKLGELLKYPTNESNKNKRIEFDKTKQVSIARFLNTYSHNDTIPDPDHEECAISEARNICKDIMDLIKFLNKDHYRRMVELIGENNDDQNTNT